MKFARFKFAYLLLSLIAVIFLNPFVSAQLIRIEFTDLLLMMMLIAGVFVVADEKRPRIIVCIAAVVSLSSQLGWVLAGSSNDHAMLMMTYLVSTLFFYLVIVAALLRSLFFKLKTVSQDTLCCAACVYLMFGLIWAILYTLLEILSPNSFTFPPEAPTDQARFDRFLGFSLTTLTTLGYGNISPANRQADSLATLQAIVGQFYLAIVIARLVAIQITQASSRSSRANSKAESDS